MNKMISRGYDLPEFRLYAGEEAIKYLADKYAIDNTGFTDSGMILVFQLPKPIARFWYRGGDDSWGNENNKVPPNDIEWGKLYRDVLPSIWQIRDAEQAFGALDMFRVNYVNEHDHNDYYYLWYVRNKIPEDDSSKLEY